MAVETKHLRLLSPSLFSPSLARSQSFWNLDLNEVSARGVVGPERHASRLKTTHSHYILAIWSPCEDSRGGTSGSKMEDLRALVAQCGINASESRMVRERASEILRKMSTVVPLGALGKARSCKSLLAIELACRAMNKMFIKEKVMAQTQVGAKDFQQALQNCKSLLKLSFTKTSAIDVLSVQFGVEMKEPTLKLLALYRHEYVAKLEKARRSLIDLGSPEYQAAAFLVVSKKAKQKMKVDKRRVCEICDVSSKLVQNIVEDLEKIQAKTEKGKDPSSSSEPTSGGSSSSEKSCTEATAGLKPKGQMKMSSLTAKSTLGSSSNLAKLGLQTEAKKESRMIPNFANKENLVGQHANSMKVEMSGSASSFDPNKDPFTSMIDRLTSSRADTTTTSHLNDMKPLRLLNKHDIHEAARAKEASRKEDEEVKRRDAAKKKRERFENWKEDLLKKKKRASADC